MHDSPADLVLMSYLNLEAIQQMRAAGLRVWFDSNSYIRSTDQTKYFMAFVESWVLDIRRKYVEFGGAGERFAGLSEWEFIVSAAPAKDGNGY
jgi:hypothetical protein